MDEDTPMPKPVHCIKDSEMRVYLQYQFQVFGDTNACLRPVLRPLACCRRRVSRFRVQEPSKAAPR